LFYKKYVSLSIPPPDGRGKDEIFFDDAQFLHIRCINTVENIPRDRGTERTNEDHQIQAPLNQCGWWQFSCTKLRENILLKTAFYPPSGDKYIADQTSSIKPVEAASAVPSSAVGIQLGWNSSSFRSAEAYIDQWIVVGTIQATLPCDLETFRCRLIWLGMLALDKTGHKSRSPNRTFPEMGCSNQRARRAIIGRTRPLLALMAKSASPTMTAVTSSDLNRQYLAKVKARDSPVIDRGSQGHVTYDELINTCKGQRNTNLSIDGGPRTWSWKREAEYHSPSTGDQHHILTKKEFVDEVITFDELYELAAVGL
jgi:hypothetical protein